MIRIEECILYRDFAEGEVLRDMTILVETYKKLVNAQISLKDRRFRENMSAYEPQFYEALNRLVEMANLYRVRDCRKSRGKHQPDGKTRLCPFQRTV